MFTVKICGVTTPQDAVNAAGAGADAIGLNFYARSPRCVKSETAREIAEALRGGALVIGVFVNHGPDEVARLADRVPLGAVQLHGDETPEYLAALPAGLPVIRAMRIGPAGLAPAAAFRDACSGAGRPLAGVLLDASVPAAPGEEAVYGGTGLRLDWPRVAAERRLLAGTPLLLAGGLTPGNVAQAIRSSGAEGVDTASGVEVSPGVKDDELVRRFVTAARGAFGER